MKYNSIILTDINTTIDWQGVWDKIFNWLTTTGIKIVLGIIVLIILFKLINAFAKRIKKRMEKKNCDKTITMLVYSIIRKGLKIVIFILFLSYVGLETASLGTIVASVGVCVGLALQGSLSNLAGGIVIFVMRPFRIGDFVEAQGQSGTVEEIKVFYTYLVTPDNKVVMIPNGIMANGTIINYSMKDLRRVDFQFSISYNESIDKAKKTINDVINNMENVLETPAPFVRVISHGESAINICTRVWAKSEDYWTVYFDMIEKIKVSFDQESIEIPYNQLDVHVKKD